MNQAGHFKRGTQTQLKLKFEQIPHKYYSKKSIRSEFQFFNIWANQVRYYCQTTDVDQNKCKPENKANAQL